MSKIIEGEKIDSIVNSAIDNVDDEMRKKIILFLLNHASSYWQWITKRFFIYEDCILLPHGVRAKDNTEKIPIV